MVQHLKVISDFHFHFGVNGILIVIEAIFLIYKGEKWKGKWLMSELDSFLRKSTLQCNMHWIKASAKYVNVYIFYMLLGEQKTVNE